MTSASHSPAQTGGDEDVKQPGLDLSVAKIAGGALAAVTTALAASFLGVTGTLSGAAFGSVVSSVAAAIYAHSLKTAHFKIKTSTSVVLRPATDRSAAGGQPSAAGDPVDPTSVPADLTGRSLQLPGSGEVTPSRPAAPPSVGPPSWTSPSAAYGSAAGSGAGAGGGGGGFRAWWKPAAALAALAFLISLAVISLTEVAIGHPISDSSGSGLTISHVGGESHEKPTPTRGPTRSPSDSLTPSTDSSSSWQDHSATSGSSPGESNSGGAGRTGQTGSVGPSDTGGGAPPQPTDAPQPTGADVGSPIG